MMNFTELFKRMTLGFVLACVPLVGGCGDQILTWQEEVKLLDGRVITVTQKRRIEERIEREAWLTFKLPEFGDKEIVWHESLGTLVLNIYSGKLYIVAYPPTKREFIKYGSPMPSYIGYRYESEKWLRIPFNEIPVAIYNSNMYIENMAITKLKQVSLADKEALMQNKRYPNELKKIDPFTKNY